MEETGGLLIGPIHTADHAHESHEDESVDSNDDNPNDIILSYLDRPGGEEKGKRQLELNPRRGQSPLQRMTALGNTSLLDKPPAPTIDQAFQRSMEYIREHKVIRFGQMNCKN